MELRRITQELRQIKEILSGERGREKEEDETKHEESEEAETEEERELWRKVKRRAEKERKKREEESEEIEREKGEELGRREKRKNNIIWRGIEGEEPEERRKIMEMIMEKELGRKVMVRGVVERMGEGGKEVLVVELENEKDKRDLLERAWKIKKRWEIGVDEGLTMEERRTRWRIVEKARIERRKGRRVKVEDNRRLWIDGMEWYWDEEEERWREAQI